MARVVKTNSKKVLEIKDIKKSFFDNSVLKGVNFDVHSGDVLGLLGSNGAGKSTLMKIINGIYSKDSGDIYIDGEIANISSAADSHNYGIAMVYQEFSLIPTLTVAQNIFLNVEPKRGGIIDDKQCNDRTAELLQEFGVEIDPDTTVEELSMGDQQLVEIVKALSKRPRILILDEPTASLTSTEITMLFGFINKLRKQDIAVLFISHHMQEIMEVCNRAVILRDGVVELDDYVENLSVSKMVEAMIGASIDKEFIPPKQSINRKVEPKLKVENLSYGSLIENLEFQVYPGEIVGIAGLLGSGRTEILQSLMRLSKPSSMKVTIDGKEASYRNPWGAITEGLYLVPENRRKNGIITIHTIQENIMMSVWKKFAGAARLIDDKAAKVKAQEKKEQLDIVSRSLDQDVQELSGGNQQKVVLAKALMTDPKILLLDDPTVGVDVEAKDAIANLIRAFSDRGSCVVMASSEMDQLAKVCDRVIVLSNGKIRTEITRESGNITEAYLNEAIQI